VCDVVGEDPSSSTGYVAPPPATIVLRLRLRGVVSQVPQFIADFIDYLVTLAHNKGTQLYRSFEQFGKEELG
jgi:hypothetical protein